MRVSVITPVYNAERYVRQAVESALAQPETGEVILIEDGSRDNSLQVCRDCAREDDRVLLLRHPDGRNHGAGASRNLGLRSATCDYVAFLDADDFFLPGRFRTACQILERHADMDGVHETVGNHFEDEQARSRWFSQSSGTLSTMTEPVQPERLFEALVVGDKGLFCTDGIVVRKRIFERTGFFDEHLRLTQDTAMWIKMAAVGRLVPGRLGEPVAMRRTHERNRIFSPTRVIEHYRALMWRTLFDWGYRKGLDWSRLDLLLKRHLEWSCRPLFRDAGPGVGLSPKHCLPVRKLLEGCIVLGLVAKYPRLIRSSFLWEHVRRTTRLSSLNVRR